MLPILILLGLVLNGHCQSPSSKSESTLPPRLTEIKDFSCKIRQETKPNTIPIFFSTLIVYYNSEKTEFVEVNAGKIWMTGSRRKAKHQALDLCEDVQESIEREVVRELKRTKE